MNLSDTATMNVESQQFDRLLRQGRLEAAVAALCIALGVLGANGLVPVTSLAIWVALGLLFVSGRLAMAEGARRRFPRGDGGSRCWLAAPRSAGGR